MFSRETGGSVKGVILANNRKDKGQELRCAHCASMVWAAGIVVMSSPAWGAVVYKNVAELTALARPIVLGDVIEVSSFWNPEHTLIESRIVDDVDVYLVGQGSSLEVLQMSGGTGARGGLLPSAWSRRFRC